MKKGTTDEGRGTADDGLRDFLLILRQALLMVVRWIEKRYDLKRSDKSE